MASFGSNNPFGDRGFGGGREHGRRGLPATARAVVLVGIPTAPPPTTAAATASAAPAVAPAATAATTTTTAATAPPAPPPAATTAATTTITATTAAAVAAAIAAAPTTVVVAPPPAPAPALAPFGPAVFLAPLPGIAPPPVLAPAPTPAPAGRLTRSQTRTDPPPALPVSTLPARPRPRPQPRPQASSTSSAAPTAPTTGQYPHPPLETHNLQPWTFRKARANNMKLTQVVRYRGLRVGDELWWDNGSHRQGARVTYIAQGGLIYLDVLDHLGRPGQPFDQADGTPFFTDPESIIGALATHGRRTLPLPPYAGTGLTPWNALEVLRGGRRVGTLNEVREDLRVRGSQQAAPRGSRRRRGGGGGGRRTAVAAPAPAPAPTTAAGDTTGAEGAEEDEMEVDEEDEDGGAD